MMYLKKIKVIGSLLFLLLPSFSVFAVETAGQVIISTGTFIAIGSNNQQRTLSRGSTIYEGDTLVTDAQGSAQIRLTDGTLSHLPASTRYRVDTYRVAAKNRQSSYTATLVTGGLQQLTGAIAKQNPQNVRTSSNVATIGIRGTFYETALSGKKQAVGVMQGRVEFKPRQGRAIEVNSESFNKFAVTTGSGTPERLSEPPSFLMATFNPQTADITRDIQEIKISERETQASTSTSAGDPTREGAANNPFEITNQQVAASPTVVGSDEVPM